MSALHIFSAEFRKAISLPGIWVAYGVGLLGVLGIAALNATSIRQSVEQGRADELVPSSAFDLVFTAAPIATVAAVVIGVLVISSEYTANSPDSGGGRQISTTLVAVPNRLLLLAAKCLVVIVLIGVFALLVIPAALGVVELLLQGAATASTPVSDALRQALGGLLYWVLTALIALAITTFVRSGLIPLVVLILNSAVVPISLLLTNVTSLAFWLPDLAGRKLFDVEGIEGGPSTTTGAIVMALWTVALLVIAAFVFTRRDA